MIPNKWVDDLKPREHYDRLVAPFEAEVKAHLSQAAAERDAGPIITKATSAERSALAHLLALAECAGALHPAGHLHERWGELAAKCCHLGGFAGGKRTPPVELVGLETVTVQKARAAEISGALDAMLPRLQALPRGLLIEVTGLAAWYRSQL